MPLARRPDSFDNVSTVSTVGCLILFSIAQAVVDLRVHWFAKDPEPFVVLFLL